MLTFQCVSLSFRLWESKRTITPSLCRCPDLPTCQRKCWEQYSWHTSQGVLPSAERMRTKCARDRGSRRNRAICILCFHYEISQGFLLYLLLARPQKLLRRKLKSPRLSLHRSKWKNISKNIQIPTNNTHNHTYTHTHTHTFPPSGCDNRLSS